MSENQEEVENKEPEPKKEKKRSKSTGIRISILINIIVLVLIVIGGISAFLLHQSDTNPNFCALCHNMDRNVDSYLTSTKLDNVHYQAGVQCKECHFEYTIPDEIVSGIKFFTGNYDKTMTKRKYSDEMCLECHINLSYQAVKTDFLVKNPHQSHWPDLKCTACHMSHEEQIDYCSQCHDNGGQRMIGDEIIPRADNPWAE